MAAIAIAVVAAIVESSAFVVAAAVVAADFGVTIAVVISQSVKVAIVIVAVVVLEKSAVVGSAEHLYYVLSWAAVEARVWTVLPERLSKLVEARLILELAPQEAIAE